MNSNCVEVDELILQLADYKNDYADVAAEKLLRKCSRSWEAYQYLENHRHDTWLPDSARQQLRGIITVYGCECISSVSTVESNTTQPLLN